MRRALHTLRQSCLNPFSRVWEFNMHFFSNVKKPLSLDFCSRKYFRAPPPQMPIFSEWLVKPRLFWVPIIKIILIGQGHKHGTDKFCPTANVQSNKTGQQPLHLNWTIPLGLKQKLWIRDTLRHPNPIIMKIKDNQVKNFFKELKNGLYQVWRSSQHVTFFFLLKVGKKDDDDLEQ